MDRDTFAQSGFDEVSPDPHAEHMEAAGFGQTREIAIEKDDLARRGPVEPAHLAALKFTRDDSVDRDVTVM